MSALDTVLAHATDFPCSVADADAACAEVAALRAENERMRDLVRYQRAELHAAKLITDEEYATLLSDHGAVARLEGYDALRARVATLEAALRDVLSRIEDAVDCDLVGEDWRCVTTYDADLVRVIDSAIRALPLAEGGTT